MVIVDKVAAVYAEALLELARKEKVMTEVDAELGQLAAVLVEDPMLWSFCKSPILVPAEKLKVFDAVLKPQLTELLYNFIGVVTGRRRLEYLPAIARGYSILVDRELGQQRVQVQSSVEITEAMSSALKESLEKLFGNKVILESSVVPDLIGGMVVRSGDYLIDSSIRTGLTEIKKGLLKRKILGEEFYEN